MGQDNNQSKVLRNLAYAFLALVLIMLVGTLGYRILGGDSYSWLDCFYMTFITLTTIGYTEVVDVSGYSADSTRRCNKLVKSFCRCFIV